MLTIQRFLKLSSHQGDLAKALSHKNGLSHTNVREIVWSTDRQFFLGGGLHVIKFC